ncbi:hypothetical protein [Roseibium algae]|uniref:Uncharacterized protein n=1 Tax=Roseibium algae TaxID=3123038 RepID=A0ABU8TQK6_9HYPH
MSDLILCPGNKRLKPVVIKTATIEVAEHQASTLIKKPGSERTRNTITLPRLDWMEREPACP